MKWWIKLGKSPLKAKVSNALPNTGIYTINMETITFMLTIAVLFLGGTHEGVKWNVTKNK